MSQLEDAGKPLIAHGDPAGPVAFQFDRHGACVGPRAVQSCDQILIISTLFESIAGLVVIAKDVPSDAHLRQLTDLLIAGFEARPPSG